MGCTKSSPQFNVKEQMMPLYYIRNPVITPEMAVDVRKSWNLIVLNQAKNYYKALSLRLTHCESCLTWFYLIFMERLRYTHPMMLDTFSKDIFALGKFLLQLVSILLVAQSNRARYDQLMISFYQTLSNDNFLFYELGIIGDVLFFALKACLLDDFTVNADYAWRVVYSVFLLDMAELFLKDRKMNTAKLRHIRSATSTEYSTSSYELNPSLLHGRHI